MKIRFLLVTLLIACASSLAQNYPESYYPEYNQVTNNTQSNFTRSNLYPESNVDYPESTFNTNVYPEFLNHQEYPEYNQEYREYPETYAYPENAAAYPEYAYSEHGAYPEFQSAREYPENTFGYPESANNGRLYPESRDAREYPEAGTDLHATIKAYDKYIKQLEEAIAEEENTAKKEALMSKLAAFYQYRAQAQKQLDVSENN